MSSPSLGKLVGGCCPGQEHRRVLALGFNSVTSFRPWEGLWEFTGEFPGLGHEVRGPGGAKKACRPKRPLWPLTHAEVVCVRARVCVCVRARAESTLLYFPHQEPQPSW